MGFEHGLDARMHRIPLRMRALIQNLSSQRLKLRPELRRVAHLCQPVDQHFGQPIKLRLYVGALVHPGAAPRSSATR